MSSFDQPSSPPIPPYTPEPYGLTPDTIREVDYGDGPFSSPPNFEVFTKNKITNRQRFNSSKRDFSFKSEMSLKPNRHSGFKNIFLCLVHEKPECIKDLVDNLNAFDPDSDILLYNGSEDETLLDALTDYDVEIYPCPTPKKWGWLHDFALDGMQYALMNMSFDTITIVDSDQLLLQSGYSQRLAQTLKYGNNIGMLCDSPQKQEEGNLAPVAAHAIKERALWQPLLDMLPNGNDAFLHWSFWPSTVFTYAACMKLVDWFNTNDQLQEVLEKTTIWASEEVILPTLVKGLGFETHRNPCSNALVKYKETYSIEQIKEATQRTKEFWIHPVPRDMDNELRVIIASIAQAQIRDKTVSISHDARHEIPMVSCITPTFERADLLKQCVLQFLEQDYKNKELIIIDDSLVKTEIAEIKGFENIRHIHLTEKQAVGKKRNMACNYAKGNIIVHWDDDDWYASNWISSQVKILVNNRTQITGLESAYFYEENTQKAYQYKYPVNQQKWVHGATLAYWKSVWQAYPFSEINIGEDNDFVWNASHSVKPHAFIQGYLGRIHPANTSPKQIKNEYWSIIDRQTVLPILEANITAAH